MDTVVLPSGGMTCTVAEIQAPSSQEFVLGPQHALAARNTQHAHIALTGQEEERRRTDCLKKEEWKCTLSVDIEKRCSSSCSEVLIMLTASTAGIHKALVS
jgi:hypothetical protein